MRFLLLGGTGQVGQEVLALAAAKQAEIIAPSRQLLDLQDGAAITKMIGSVPWDAVINAAAYTDVDRAEREEELAFAANARGPAQLAAEAGRKGIPLIHISTDYVFDGRKGAPYVEDDPTGPVNAYGRSKLAGEEAIRAHTARHVIVRTAWVFSPHGRNFVKTILRLARERDELTIVADQRGCPTGANSIAEACLEIAVRCAAERDAAPYGTYHFAGAGEATWYEFASSIVEMAADRLKRSPRVVPIRTVDYPTPAARAADTRLDSTAVFRAFGVAPRPWPSDLAATLDRLLGPGE
jgi:dTDP-4-dehydrorhamnose reductase